MIIFHVIHIFGSKEFDWPLWLHSPNNDSDLSVNDKYKLPIKIWKVWKVSNGKSFIHQRASDCDFFSNTHKKGKKKEKKKKKRVIAILESMTWISDISKFGKCYDVIIIA